MPLPMDIKFITPEANITLKGPIVTVEVKVKDPYSTQVKAMVSINGSGFLEMEKIGEDAEGYAHFCFVA